MSSHKTAPFALVADNKALPLALRKDIRDNEQKKLDALKRIEKVTSVAFSLEFEGDLVELNEKSPSYKNRLGEILLGSYMNSIASFFEKDAAHSLYKDFLAQIPTNTIVIRASPLNRVPGGPYQDITIEDGKLYVTFQSPENMWSNMSEIENKDFAFVTVVNPPTTDLSDEFVLVDINKGRLFSKDNKALPLALRRNIEEYEKDRTENLKRISDAAGIPFEFDVEYKTIQEKVSAEYKDRLGEVFFKAYLEEIGDLLKKKLADDMVKEAFLESATKRLIIVRVAKTPRPSGGLYQRLSIDDGILVVEFDIEHLWTNVHEIANCDLESIL